MLKAGMHFGHKTSKWNPKMAPYIFTQRHGVHIIDLIKTQKLLGQALEFIEKFSQEGKTILFVGTKMQVKELIKKIAINTNNHYVVEKWMGGTLTNFPVVKKVIKKYNTLTSDKANGRLEKYTKKERVDIDKDLAKLELKVGGLKNLNKLPDALFIWDITKEKNAVQEARRKNIPIIAVCDTNANPEGINYPIPSNDDATKTIKLILSLVEDTIKNAKTNLQKTELKK